MSFALETIDYQIKDSFPKVMIGLVGSVYSEIDKRKLSNTRQLITGDGPAAEIEKVIFQRLGMKVKFTKELHAITPAAVIPFFGDYFRNAKEMNKFQAGELSTLFSFSHKAVQEYQQLEKHRKAQLKKLDGRTGYIDTKTAKVGGYLSEIEHYLIIDFVLLKEFGLSVEETVAVMLHELGHAFDGLEEHNRLESTNRSIYDILTELNGKDYEKASYLFKNKFTKEEFKDSMLKDDKQRHDFCGKLAKAYLGEVRSQIYNSKYNETNYENMSDTFATRFGMGKELVSALVKLIASHGGVLPNNKLIYVAAASLDLLGAAATFLIFPVWGALVFWGIMLMLYNSDSVDMTYDFPMDRFNRVRNTIIGALKKLDMPKEVVQEFLTQYDYITQILESYMAPKGLSYELADVLLPHAREARYYSDLQKSLENSLNNELFVKSAQLKVLS